MRQHDRHKKFLTIGFYVDLEDRTVVNFLSKTDL